MINQWLNTIRSLGSNFQDANFVEQHISLDKHKRIILLIFENRFDPIYLTFESGISSHFH